VVRPWPRLPREAVAAPSLTGFKPRLDGAWSNLLWWKGSLPLARGLEQDDLSGPFQHKPFYDLCGTTCDGSLTVAVYPTMYITESQNGRGWKGPLWVI